MRSSRQFSFLNGPNKLVFVRMYGSGSTIPLLFACSVLCFFVVFSAFWCLFLCIFVLYCTHNNTHKQKLTNKTKI